MRQINYVYKQKFVESVGSKQCVGNGAKILTPPLPRRASSFAQFIDNRENRFGVFETNLRLSISRGNSAAVNEPAQLGRLGFVSTFARGLTLTIYFVVMSFATVACSIRGAESDGFPMAPSVRDSKVLIWPKGVGGEARSSASNGYSSFATIDKKFFTDRIEVDNQYDLEVALASDQSGVEIMLNASMNVSRPMLVRGEKLINRANAGIWLGFNGAGTFDMTTSLGSRTSSTYACQRSANSPSLRIDIPVRDLSVRLSARQGHLVLTDQSVGEILIDSGSNQLLSVFYGSALRSFSGRSQLNNVRIVSLSGQLSFPQNLTSLPKVLMIESAGVGLNEADFRFICADRQTLTSSGWSESGTASASNATCSADQWYSFIYDWSDCR